MPSTRDLVGIIELGYDDQSEESEWLTHLCQRARPWLDDGLGIFAYTWELRQGRPEVRSVAQAGASAELLSYPARLLQVLGAPRARRLLCANNSLSTILTRIPTAGIAADCGRCLLPAGAADVSSVIGRASLGRGLVVSVPLRQQSRWSRQQRRAWSLVASHLAFALELRTASGGAFAPPLTAGLELAAGAMRRATPAEAERILHGLTDGSWLITRVEGGAGGELLLAAKRDAGLASSERLGAHEREVARAAVLGHSHKLIAYDLKMAPTRVAHHLRSAMLKLGVSTRAELQRRWMLESAELVHEDHSDAEPEPRCTGTD